MASSDVFYQWHYRVKLVMTAPSRTSSRALEVQEKKKGNKYKLCGEKESNSAMSLLTMKSTNFIYVVGLHFDEKELCFHDKILPLRC
jgi:hypothetical protein